jgi:ATP-dependent Lon protease
VLKQNNMYDNILLDEDIVSNIIKSKHTDTIKKIMLNKLLSIKDISDDYYKCVEWINTILLLPTECNNNLKNNSKIIIKNLHDNLHKNLYGMDKTIKHILQSVSAILNDRSKGSILTLVGQSGVGKTTISSLISKSIGMGFGQISCGNINDISTLIGHSSTYIGAKTGLFTQIQINNKQIDNVVLLDEMDKITDTKITPILLHVLDFSQNNRFKDAYCPEIDIDLSKNLYIISVNSTDKFDTALLDRMKIINVDGYDLEQKCEICIKHIIPKCIERTGINKTIDKTVLKKYLSPNKTGVRDVERFIENIYEKLLLATHLGNSYIGLPVSYKVMEKGKIDDNIIKYICN